MIKRFVSSPPSFFLAKCTSPSSKAVYMAYIYILDAVSADKVHALHPPPPSFFKNIFGIVTLLVDIFEPCVIIFLLIRSGNWIRSVYVGWRRCSVGGLLLWSPCCRMLPRQGIWSTAYPSKKKCNDPFCLKLCGWTCIF